MRLFTTEHQLGDRKLEVVTTAEAVKRGLIKSPALAYFMARTWLFLVSVGANPEYMRMRQHLPNEMAHYSKACFDAELLTTYGWIEVVGHADRAAYDLAAHTDGSGTRLDVHESWPEAKWQQEKKVEANVEAAKVGAKLRKRAAGTMAALADLAAKKPAEALAFEEALAKNGKASINVASYEVLLAKQAAEKAAKEGKPYKPDVAVDSDTVEVTRDMVSFKEVTITVKGETVQPHVIEPAFGIGRIMYSIFEHSFRQRVVQNEAEKRWYLSLPAIIAPIKFSVLPLVTHSDVQKALANEVRTILLDLGYSAKLDATHEAIGRRYARTDEIGIPFGVTIDNQSKDDRTVTVRERDSCAQVRVKIDELHKVARDLMKASDDGAWGSVVKRHDLKSFDASAVVDEK